MSADPLADVLLSPRSVAVVGASANQAKTAGRPIHFLKKHGFAGKIWPVNPGRSEVQGLPAFASLGALPAVPDQVFVALDTEPALAAVEEAVGLGVPLVQVLANGFSESGAEGKARESRLRDILRGSRTRVLGPNSLGFVRPATGFVCTANAAFAADQIPAGSISVISQSGSAIGTFVSRGRPHGIGFANLVSVGNEADLSLGEIGLRLVDDPATGSFILFLETIRHTEALEAFAMAADAAGKSVLVYKLGRSEAGAELAVSHTGAMLSSDAAADAYLRDLGFSRVDIFESVFEGAALFSRRWRSPDRARPRVAVVSTTGGGGALVVDRLGLEGTEIATPSAKTRDRIADAGVAVGDGALIDLTLAGTNPAVMSSAIDALLDDDTNDAVVAVIGSSAEYFPDLAVKPIMDVLNRRPGPQKPVAVFTVPHAERALRLLAEGGIAGFRTPESCANALSARLRRRRPHFRRTSRNVVVPDVAAALAQLPARLTEKDALDLFRLAGLPVVPFRYIPVGQTSDIAEKVAELQPPFVLKVSSPDLPHKSDAGGVVLDIAGRHELVKVLDAMTQVVARRAPDAKIDGYLVQEQRKGLQELILGLSRDLGSGAIVTLGAGGVLAEIYADASMRRAPVSKDEALEMIAEVKSLAVSRGYRGAPRGDLDALAETVADFSRLAAYEQIAEAEINPLMIGRETQGVWAVDGLIVLKPKKEG